MFFQLVNRNSRRSRKENGLFFTSLLIAIIAFYMILSLSQQDVILFLRKMESDAVNRLLSLIPVFYGMTLFILFFLIYYASRFQLERRRHEFGIYLMMGMSRIKLFFLLLAEDLRSSVAALLAGLPVAVLLSEIVSLVTSRLVGMGIIGHRFSLSVMAVIWTAAGFYMIKLFAFLILSWKIARQEIGGLLADTPEAARKSKPGFVYMMAFLSGIVLLILAYSMAISGIAWYAIDKMGITVLMGLAGTMLLFFGLRFFLGLMAACSRGRGLQAFTFRQLQENVIRRSNTLAISSLLVLAALCCFGSGVAIVQDYSGSERHILDYTFEENGRENDIARVKNVLADQELDSLFSDLFEMRIGYIKTDGDYDNVLKLDNVMQAVEENPKTEERDVLLNTLENATYPHIIALSGYNHLLELAGQPAIVLKERQAAVYMDEEYISSQKRQILQRILSKRPEVTVNDETYQLMGQVHSINLVTDRSITLSFALVVSDKAFEHFTKGDYSIYVNGVLDRESTGQNSLMNAIADTNSKLRKTGLSYESYLQNMGRQLFYMVAAGYVTIYLAIIFLIVANTVIGVQFLTGQQKTGKRYQTLIRIGASYEMLCQATDRQVRWYFGMPVVVAAVSSIFGVRALFSGLLSSRAEVDTVTMMLISAAMILLLCVIEYIYIRAVKKAGRQNILNMMVPEREE